jgi:hypothetical protein
MKVINCKLNSANRRADDSVSLKLDSLLEISSKELGEIDSYRGSVAVVTLTDSIVGNDVLVNVDDVIKNLPENDTFDAFKSPSKKQKAIMYRYLEAKLGRMPLTEEFTDFYVSEMKKIFQHYADKIDKLKGETE